MVYDLFGAACELGLEGIVSKRCDRSYSPGKSKHWIKVKNPAHPAYNRVRDQLGQVHSMRVPGR
jgi:bifunctional non-homologous end joining protein LigD